MLRKIVLGCFALLMILIKALLWVLWATVEMFSKIYNEKYRNDLKKPVFFGGISLFLLTFGFKVKMYSFALFGVLLYLSIGLMTLIYIRKKWGKSFL